MNAFLLWTIYWICSFTFLSSILLFHYYNIKNKSSKFKVTKKIHYTFIFIFITVHITGLLICFALYSSLRAISFFCLSIFIVFNACFFKLKTKTNHSRYFYALILKYNLLDIGINLVMIDLYLKYESENPSFEKFYHSILFTSSLGSVISISNCIFYLLHMNKNQTDLVLLDMKNLSEVPEEDCPICLEPYNTKQCVKTECSHIYHQECIKKSLESVLKCPMCRRDFEMYICV